MRPLAEIQFELGQIHSAIGVWQPHLADPNVKGSVLLNVQSLRRKAEKLEQELLDAAKRLGVDVCSYRLFADDERQPAISGVAASMSAFQAALSTIYDAITDRPKERARYSAVTAEKTKLEYAYGFAGSAGFVLTVASEKLLLDEVGTKLNEAVGLLFEVANSTESESIGQYVPKIGHGGVRAVRAWVASHADSMLGADIEWHRNKSVDARLFKQPREWRELKRVIDQTSEEKMERIELVGELYAANTKTKSFSLRYPTGAEVSGSFSDAISEAHQAVLPQAYRVTLDVTTKVHYSLQENEVSVFLVAIKPVA